MRRQRTFWQSVDELAVGRHHRVPSRARGGCCEVQLVLQLPGTVISSKSFHRGTFYLFGCARHPEQTKSLGQFT